MLVSVPALTKLLDFAHLLFHPITYNEKNKKHMSSR